MPCTYNSIAKELLQYSATKMMDGAKKAGSDWQQGGTASGISKRIHTLKLGHITRANRSYITSSSSKQSMVIEPHKLYMIYNICTTYLSSVMPLCIGPIILGHHSGFSQWIDPVVQCHTLVDLLYIKLGNQQWKYINLFEGDA